MDSLIKQRAICKGFLTRAEKFIKSFSLDSLSINDLKVREEGLREAYKNYCNVQDQIESLDDKQENDREEFEVKYFSLLSQIRTFCDRDLQAKSSTSGTSTPVNFSPEESNNFKRAKLPLINVPTFSGAYEDWNSFRDLFMSLIDKNKDLSPVDKLHYLKLSLSKEPLRLIQHLETTDVNYKQALDTLHKRFDNKFRNVNIHVKAILELKALTKSSAPLIREFLTQIQQRLDSLRSLKLPVENWDTLLVCIILQKLDFQTHKEFVYERNKNEIPLLKELLECLEKKCDAIETASDKFPTVNHTEKSVKVVSHVTQSAPTVGCSYCKLKGHPVYRCYKFKKLSVNDRDNFLKTKKLCRRCLMGNHTLSDCSLQFTCRICNLKEHHTLLHANPPNFNTGPSSYNQGQSNRIEGPNNASVSLMSHSIFNTENLLPTVILKVITKSGSIMYARALLDSASTTNFITETLVQKLNLEPYNRQLEILGVGEASMQANKMLDIKIKSRLTNFEKKISCGILQSITTELPNFVVDQRKIIIPDSIKDSMADFEFHKPREVDILLGCDIFFETIAAGKLNLGANLPQLQNTLFGWVVVGNVPSLVCRNTKTSCITNLALHNSLDERVEKFWKLEELPETNNLKLEEEYAEKHFNENISRSKNGQYIVGLPFKNDHFPERELGNSVKGALRRFLMLERKLIKNENLKTKYTEFINEYITLGHASFIPFDFENLAQDPGFFLPHHGVINELSETTKLRVVFDGSAKGSFGYSLNDLLSVGPIVQPELFDIICKFRLFKYVFTADIEKMFRQILVKEEDQKYQRIIWRVDSNTPLQCMQLHTVTYGLSSSPYLAARTLVQLAKDEGKDYPLAKDVLLNNFYVDDVLCGKNELLEAKDLQSQLIKLLGRANFKLHKWHSNEPSLIPLAESSGKLIQDNTFLKTLGVQWNPLDDIFQINLLERLGDINQESTKRNILSIIARFFDPLGFIAPIIISAKIIMQNTWLEKINWDQSISPKLKAIWDDFKKELVLAKQININRWCLNSNSKSIELHCFSDASEKAYGACVYLRARYNDNTYSSNLFCAKSKVAPLKNLSIPRMELCGALVCAQLAARVNKTIAINISKIFLWTDSKVVLAWIKAPASRWTSFVSNRVSKIQELTLSEQYIWAYVPTKLNPADLISRGVKPSKLQNLQFWWHGPKFLHQELKEPDLLEHLNNDNIEIPEYRKIITYVSVDQPRSRIEFLEKYSNFTKLQRVVAYILRFINNIRNKNKKLLHTLSTKELHSSLILIVRLMQEESFAHEIKLLKDNTFSDHPLFNKSLLKSLNPFLDKWNCLRVGGRLENAPIAYEQKHPLILPANHKVTKLILQKEHLRLLHAGTASTLASVRLKFWPLKAKNTIKKIIHNCLVCRRFKGVTASQLMGNLPVDRTTPTRPFEITGVDYAGPISIKASPLRKAKLLKAYIALFICMCTKAVHLELVSSLSTDAFIAALKRFVSRRGLPQKIYCDNGSNFKGANTRLKELYEAYKTQNKTLKNECSRMGIQFYFNPPYAPHMGGLWESNIKCMKTHLYKTLGTTSLTFEEMSTCLTQIEAILNSRPLFAISDDINDLDYLSPSHFLIGQSLTDIPEPSVLKIQSNRLKIWQYITKLKQNFWKQWSGQYLQTLQHRHKWAKIQPDVVIGALVFIKEDNLPPQKWAMGKIIETYKGQDGKVRVALLKTKQGVVKRPIHKLSLLPTEAEEN